MWFKFSCIHLISFLVTLILLYMYSSGPHFFAEEFKKYYAREGISFFQVATVIKRYGNKEHFGLDWLVNSIDVKSYRKQIYYLYIWGWNLTCDWYNTRYTRATSECVHIVSVIISTKVFMVSSILVIFLQPFYDSETEKLCWLLINSLAT